MSFRILTILLAAGIALTSAAEGLAAPTLYFGIGFHSASFAEDLEPGKIVSIAPGPGAAVNLGMKLSPYVSLEARAGRTFQKEQISSSDVNLEWQEGGVFLYPTASWKTRPFLGVGVGSYDVKTTGLDFSGKGAFAALGLEEVVSEHHSGKLYVQGTRWRDDDFDLDVKGFHVGLMYSYTF